MGNQQNKDDCGLSDEEYMVWSKISKSRREVGRKNQNFSLVLQSRKIHLQEQEGNQKRRKKIMMEGFKIIFTVSSKKVMI